MGSLVDQVYRSFVLSKFFQKGWGHPDQIRRLFEFRKNISNRELCMKLVDPDHPIIIDKVQLDESKECKLIDGHFRSPFADHLPGLLPEVAETAYFQMVVPADGFKGKKDRPLCIQMAGTGDHHFWRRRNFLAMPLLKDHGISSLILENPFYGLRKPQEQFRSSLNNVSDIFVMGGSLVLEGIALLQWLEKEGFGPNVVHGISMGGHMASLCASIWHKPVCLVPCLSWSTASGVFTQGVMSGALDWSTLESQFFSNNFFKDELYKMVWSDNDEAYLAGKEFVSQYKPNAEDQKQCKSASGEQEKNLFQSLTNFLKQRGLLKILPDLSSMASSTNGSAPQPSENVINTETIPPAQKAKIVDFSNMLLGKSKSKVQKEAIQFMRGVMDEFTHLKNFAKPVDPSLIIVVAARDDAYIPRDGYLPVTEIWPEASIIFVDGGHISTYLLHQKLFKKTIAQAVEKYREKYDTNGKPKTKNETVQPQLPEEDSKRVLEVLGFRNNETNNEASDTIHRV